MKKILSMLLVAAMVLSLAGCGKSAAGNAKDDAPIDVLTKVWKTYGNDEKFEANGGSINNLVKNKPGKFDVTDIESLDAYLGFPYASVALIDDAASLMHGLHANTFTAGAYHVTDTSEIEMLIADLQDNIMSREWVGDLPDTLIIIGVGENTLVSAFGEAELIETFKTKLLAVYEDAVVHCEESIK